MKQMTNIKTEFFEKFATWGKNPPIEELWQWIETLLSEQRENIRITISDRGGKPYLVIDDRSKGFETIFAADLGRIEINKLPNKQPITKQTKCLD